AAPSAAATRSIHVCVATRSFRRSRMSASAPAGTASRNIGALVPTWINVTSRGDVVSDVISHDAATSCIHVPTFDAMDAIQRPRKIARRSGAVVSLRTSIARGWASRPEPSIHRLTAAIPDDALNVRTARESRADAGAEREGF